MSKPNKPNPTVRKWHVFIVVSAIVFFALGGYMLFLTKVAPNHKPIMLGLSRHLKDVSNPNRQLIIPKIGVKTDIVVDNLQKMNEGYIVQRSKAGGDPIKGGNFVLTGHRFKMAWTPKKVQQASVLYNLNKLTGGDQIIVYWNSQKYTYKVSRLYQVKPDQIEVEAPSTESKLTLYTCTLGGTYDGRLVVEARRT